MSWPLVSPFPLTSLLCFVSKAFGRCCELASKVCLPCLLCFALNAFGYCRELASKVCLTCLLRFVLEAFNYCCELTSKHTWRHSAHTDRSENILLLLPSGRSAYQRKRPPSFSSNKRILFGKALHSSSTFKSLLIWLQHRFNMLP